MSMMMLRRTCANPACGKRYKVRMMVAAYGYGHYCCVPCKVTVQEKATL